MKKTLFVLCAFLLVVLLCACKPTHQHTFESAWNYDQDYHWHNSTCEHTGEKSDKSAHTFDPTTHLCTVCSMKNPAFCDHENDLAIVTEADCYRDGIEVRYCPDCKREIVNVEAKKLHDFNTENHKCKYCELIDPEHCSHDYHLYTYADLVSASMPYPLSNCETGTIDTYICNLCLDTYYVTNEPTEHVFEKNGYVKEAYCREAGWEEYKCLNCCASETREIASLDHKYNESHLCACGWMDPAHCPSHMYSDDYYDVYEDCTLGGTRYIKCDICGTETTENLPPRKHHFNLGIVAVTPSVGVINPSMGVVNPSRCTICGCEQTEETICKHENSERAIQSRPTCSKSGYATGFCFECNQSFTEIIPATGHSFDSETHYCHCEKLDPDHCDHSELAFKDDYNKSPSLSSIYGFLVITGCREGGIRTYSCPKCDYSYTEDLSPKAHNYVVNKYDSFLCEAGSITYTCVDCNQDGSTEGIFMHVPNKDKTACSICNKPTPDHCNHNYQKIVLDDNVFSCISSSMEVEYCSLCGSYSDYENTIPPTEHSVQLNSNESKEATCVSCGEYVYSCATCNSKMYVIITAPTGHEYDANNYCKKCHKSFDYQ